MKLDKKILIIVIIVIILSASTSYVVAGTLVKSEDVYYDKTSSGLAVNNVQAAIDGTCTKFSDQLTTLQTTIINKIYPVGSIYISYNSTNPSSLFGGTWENYGSGRVLKGINSGTAGTTGGSDTVTLKEANLPSHSHSIPQLSGSTSSDGGHTPSGTIDRKELIGSFGDLVYQELVPGGTATGIVTKGIYKGNWVEEGGKKAGYADEGFQIDASHSHTFTGNAVAAHSHTVTTNTNTTGSTGSGTSFSVQNPYITVYMWRRTK